jgi:UTP--glucose-1-phosphate uridylyltransferase
VQLTDSIAATCRTSGVSAVKYEGRRFDCGNFAGLLEANIAVSQLEETAPAAVRPDLQPAAAPVTTPAKEASAA